MERKQYEQPVMEEGTGMDLASEAWEDFSNDPWCFACGGCEGIGGMNP